MKRYLLCINLVLLLIFTNGCLYPNETGVSKWYYNDCKEYYDLAGRYHKECDNLFEYSDLNPFKQKESSQMSKCEFGDCLDW